jgi:very-short-patch-repair endonuclease
MLRLHPDQRAFSRALRTHATDAERLLWQRLRARQLDGARFRRQHPISSFVAD